MMQRVLRVRPLICGDRYLGNEALKARRSSLPNQEQTNDARASESSRCGRLRCRSWDSD